MFAMGTDLSASTLLALTFYTAMGATILSNLLTGCPLLFFCLGFGCPLPFLGNSISATFARHVVTLCYSGGEARRCFNKVRCVDKFMFKKMSDNNLFITLWAEGGPWVSEERRRG